VKNKKAGFPPRIDARQAGEGERVAKPSMRKSCPEHNTNEDRRQDVGGA
jgi:hypothetical protein